MLLDLRRRRVNLAGVAYADSLPRAEPAASDLSDTYQIVERRVAQVARTSDDAVYALYGLSDAERWLVEGQ